MIITDEPGVYIAGSHGIRTENELMICEGETTAYGRFLYFKPITLVPIDLDAVVPEMMTIEDKRTSKRLPQARIRDTCTTYERR